MLREKRVAYRQAFLIMEYMQGRSKTCKLGMDTLVDHKALHSFINGCRPLKNTTKESNIGHIS